MVGSCRLSSELLDENVIKVICICLCSTPPVSHELQKQLTLMSLLGIRHPVFDSSWGLRRFFFPEDFLRNLLYLQKCSRTALAV